LDTTDQIFKDADELTKVFVWYNQLRWIYTTFCELMVDGYLDY